MPNLRATAERQLVRERGRVVEGLVVPGESLLIPKIADIHAGIIAVGCFQVPRGVIDRLGPREGVQQVQTRAIALLEFDLERVIVQESAAKSFLDEAEVLNRTPRLHAQVLACRIRNGLIVIAKDHQTNSASAHISEVENQILR